MSRRIRKPEHFKTIDAEMASRIFDLHREHRQLGHDGLLRVIEGAGYHVDADELSDFLSHHKIHGEHWELAWGHIPGRFTPWPGIRMLGG